MYGLTNQQFLDLPLPDDPLEGKCYTIPNFTSKYQYETCLEDNTRGFWGFYFVFHRGRLRIHQDFFIRTDV